MAKKQVDPYTTVELSWPFKGLDANKSKSAQPAGTTADCLNVRAYDPTTGRNRGAQRSGMTKYCEDQVSSASAIQCLDHMILDPSQAYPFGIGALYLHSKGAWLVLDTDGNAVSYSPPMDTASGFGNYDAVFDQDGNLYVVFDDQSSPHDQQLRVKKFDWAGKLVWATTLSSGTAYKSSLGIVIYQGAVYVAASIGSTDPNVSIYKVNAQTGETVGTQPWNSPSIRMTGTTVAINTCMAIGGGYLGLAQTDTTSNTTEVITINLATGAVAGPTSLSVANDSGVSDIAGDASGNFYICWASGAGSAGHREDNYPGNQSANRLTKVDSTATIAWTNTTHTAVHSVTYDKTTARLLIAGNTLYGSASKSVAIVNVSDGTESSSGIPDSVATWTCIRADGRGDYWIADESNRLRKIDSTFAVLVSKTTSGTTGRVLACADGVSGTWGSQVSNRVVRSIAVANGTVKAFDRNGVISITSGSSALDGSRAIIWSAQNGPFIYFADGTNAKRYNAATNTIETWTPSGGSLPTNGNLRPRQIETWRGRTVLYGLEGDPQNWFMSAVNDPLDWNYGGTVLETMPVAGNSVNGVTGKSTDLINCFIPFSDEKAILGGDHTIQLLRGDPMAGGRMDQVSNSVGIAWGRPYCIDPNGVIYFFGSRPGVYRMAPGGLPESISTPIDPLLDGIDLAKTLIRLLWNDADGGFHLILSPVVPDTDTTHYWWDARNGAWFRDHFASRNHDALAVHTFDGDDPNDRALLLGGRDGYIRQLDSTADDDDGKAILSHVLLGPIQAQGMGLMVTDLQCTLGEESDEVAWSLQSGYSAENALEKQAAVVGTFKAGRSRSQAVRRFGHAHYLKLANLTKNKRWMLEKLMVTVMGQGRIRQRVF